jgi:hypothetical protein
MDGKGMTSEKTSNALNRDAVTRPSGPAVEKQTAARAALETCAGRSLSDMEWNRARATLVEFASILRCWHERTSGGSEFPMAA